MVVVHAFSGSGATRRTTFAPAEPGSTARYASTHRAGASRKPPRSRFERLPSARGAPLFGPPKRPGASRRGASTRRPAGARARPQCDRVRPGRERDVLARVDLAPGRRVEREPRRARLYRGERDRHAAAARVRGDGGDGERRGTSTRRAARRDAGHTERAIQKYRDRRRTRGRARERMMSGLDDVGAPVPVQIRDPDRAEDARSSSRTPAENRSCRRRVRARRPGRPARPRHGEEVQVPVAVEVEHVELADARCGRRTGPWTAASRG